MNTENSYIEWYKRAGGHLLQRNDTEQNKFRFVDSKINSFFALIFFSFFVVSYK